MSTTRVSQVLAEKKQDSVRKSMPKGRKRMKTARKGGEKREEEIASKSTRQSTYGSLSLLRQKIAKAGILGVLFPIYYNHSGRLRDHKFTQTNQII
jgi:hypothetical protein